MATEFRLTKVSGSVPLRALHHGPEEETGLSFDKGFAQMARGGLSPAPGSQDTAPCTQ